jgi:hypothetical protein
MKHKMKAEVIVELDGKEVYRGESKSFLVNMAKHILGAFSATGGIYYTDYGTKASAAVVNPAGSSVSIWEEWYSSTTGGGGVQLAVNAGDNDDTFGIWVGSGSTPISPNNYALASKIPHGTSSGQLDYESHAISSSYSNTSSYVEIARSFVNRSGADIIVRETGIVGRNFWRDSGGVRNDVKFLIARDVLPTPILVPNLASLTVRYRISLSL